MIRDDMYSVEGLAVVIYFKKTLVVNAFDQFISPRFVDHKWRKWRKIPAGLHDVQSRLFIILN